MMGAHSVRQLHLLTTLWINISLATRRDIYVEPDTPKLHSPIEKLLNSVLKR